MKRFAKQGETQVKRFGCFVDDLRLRREAQEVASNYELRGKNYEVGQPAPHPMGEGAASIVSQDSWVQGLGAAGRSEKI